MSEARDLGPTDLVRKDSIEALCGHRARAIELYQLAKTTLAAAIEAHKRACANRQYVSSDFLRDLRYGFYDVEKSVIPAIDRDMWKYFIVGTPLGSLMDEEERQTFERSLERGEVPTVTPDTVFATMKQLADNGETIFRRGLVNAFRRFCAEDYHSHDGFKIGKRFIVSHLVTGSGRFLYLNHHREGMIRDIDRCMHVLDGQPSPDHQQGVLAAIRTALAAQQDMAHTPYYKVRMFFGNGNSHFYPLRTDLVEKANRIIAQHYGAVLGETPR